MECVQGALKNSFNAVKPNPNHPHGDFSAVVGDDFFVDGLLDFSDDGGFEEQDDETHVVVDVNNDKSVKLSPVKTETNDTSVGFSLPENDLCLPADDVADLEWVSHFVDDSFSGGYSLTCPAGKLPEKKTEPESHVTVNPKPTLTTPVHTKARSKRSRTVGRVWSLVSSPATDSSASSSSSSSYTSNTWLMLFPESIQTAESIFGKPPVKKPKKRNVAVGAAEPAQPRRCSHCLVQKTPQWRAGPLGAKTLCNACGVRYKSGRLLPEYRPACSPTFSSEVHSNNHRKVLEMRQKKVAGGGGLTFPLRSF
ncbi:GATA transcription factor 5-like [Bidens hawaiensis]|uniref:GATA transcription factor 5-like n=1 Tax=Bidens hawaiensis TaxID=980011 RepID=UPI00404A9D50